MDANQRQDAGGVAPVMRDGPRVAARNRFDAALTADPALQGITLTDIISVAPNRSVARGWISGEEVILKQFTGPRATEIAANMAQELTLLAPHMSQGRAQVNRLIAVSAAAGLVVVSQVPGEKMSKLLPDASPMARARMMADAGAFALAYGTGRRRPDQIGAGFWMRKFARLQADGLISEDAALLEDLRKALAGQAANLHAAPLCRAAVHGDLVPINLHADENGVYGYDTQGEAFMPLSFDLARFMSWLAVDEVQPKGGFWLGVPQADKRAFLIRGLPDPDEDARILPFLLGHEIGARFHERCAPDPRSANPARAAAARRGVKRYLAAMAEDPS